MRLLIVLREFYCPSKPIGGAERQALKLAERLMDKGLTVTIVTGQWDWGQPRRENLRGVSVHRHFTGWGMFNIKGLRKFGQYIYLLTLLLYLVWHRNEYDIIHCHSALFGAAVVVVAGKWLHKKTLVRAMASGNWGDIKRMRTETSIWGTGWMLSKLKDADCVVALNLQVVSELMEIGVSADHIVRISNGVEIEQITPKTDYRLGHEVVVVFVGRLHPQKGIDVLLSAFAKAHKALPQFSWRLKLVGSGYLRRRLETMAHELSMERWVEFLGQVADPFPILSRSDIFVLPSRSEGMSNALLEALAHGLPCVATNIAGNNDVIIHEKNGLLVPLDDDTALAGAITSLVTDQQLRENLGREAIKIVQEECSIDSVTNKYISLYKNLLKGRASIE